MVQSGLARGVEGRSTLRSDPLEERRKIGQVEEEEVEELRAGRWRCDGSAGWGARWAWWPGMEEEGEGRRGEVEACWPAGPGRLGVGEEGEEQKEVRAGAEGERKWGKEAGACRCERATEEQRMRE